MRIIWIECILFESWCIEALLFILCLKSFIYIKIRHNLFAYNYMLLNLVFLLNSLSFHLLAYFFYVIPWKTFMGTIIIVAVFSNFTLAGKGSVWEHRNFLKWGIRRILCPCAGVSFSVSFHPHLTCSMWVLVMVSFPVCRMRHSSSGKGSKACVTNSLSLWGPALESSTSGSKKSWCLPCSEPLTSFLSRSRLSGAEWVSCTAGLCMWYLQVENDFERQIRGFIQRGRLSITLLFLASAKSSGVIELHHADRALWGVLLPGWRTVGGSAGLAALGACPTSFQSLVLDDGDGSTGVCGTFCCKPITFMLPARAGPTSLLLPAQSLWSQADV